MKFIYLHGYNGFVSQAKRNFLNTLGENYVPEINYDKQPTIISELIEKLSKEPVDFIAGTSLGAVVAYYVGIKMNIPVLMFNPAVSLLEMLRPLVPSDVFGKMPVSKVMIFTGAKDTVIKPEIQKNFAENLQQQGVEAEFIEWENMTHYVDYPEFKVAFGMFLEKINLTN